MALEALNDAGVWKEGVRLLVILNDNDCSISPPAGALSNHLAKIVSTRAYTCAREISKRVLKPVPGLWDIAKRMEKQAINFVSRPRASSRASTSTTTVPSTATTSSDSSRCSRTCAGSTARACCTSRPRRARATSLLKWIRRPTTAWASLIRFSAFPKRSRADRPTPKSSGAGSATRPPPTKRLYGITPAMREGSGLVEFARRYPERYRDVAIAEQHAVTYAAGLAWRGHQARRGDLLDFPAACDRPGHS